MAVVRFSNNNKNKPQVVSNHDKQRDPQFLSDSDLIFKRLKYVTFKNVIQFLQISHVPIYICGQRP
jgi:hypothetical protein